MSIRIMQSIFCGIICLSYSALSPILTYADTLSFARVQPHLQPPAFFMNAKHRRTTGYFGEVGTLQQRQVAPNPTPSKPTVQPSSAIPQTEMTLLIVGISLTAGGLIIAIGESIARAMEADLTGWKVAGILLSGISLVYSIATFSSLDMSLLPPDFQPLFFGIFIAMIAISGLQMVLEVIGLIRYVNHRAKLQEQRQRKNTTPAATSRPIVEIIPYLGPSERGMQGGLALIGRF